MNALSPAAIELLREQELQQRHEEEEEQESGTQHRKVSNGHAGHRASQHYQPSEDEEQRRTIQHTRTRSGTNGSVHSHHQSHKVTELENDGHGYQPRSGYESSSRTENISPTRRRQSQLYGDKSTSASKSTSKSNATESQQQQQQQQSNGGVDASAFTMLYKEIRDSMDASSFGLFARGTESYACAFWP